jgi:signal transduction histidine kinase
MLNSLKFKIIVVAILIISAIMSVATWRDIKTTEKRLLNTQLEKAELFSERITHGIMVLMLQNKWRDLQTMMEGLVKDAKELKDIRIFLPDSGIIVVSSEPKEIGKPVYKRDMEIFKGKNNRPPYIMEKDNQRFASKLTSIQNKKVCHRCHGSEREVLGVLNIELSLSRVFETIQKFKKEHLTEALIGSILIVAAFVLVVGVLIERPIKSMIRTIRKIESGDLAARMDEDKKDEFGLVAKSFNSMLKTLELANKEIEQCHAAQMQRAAKLASLGEIISGIAHEIKNPLTGISCAIQVFQSEMGEDDGKKAVTTEILNHIKRLDGIVKDLLNYAKPKSPRFLPFKVTDIMDKAVFFVHTEAKKHSVVIDTDIKGDISEVMMDADQMQQVFLNLMINAVQAMPNGGKLKITISNEYQRDIRNEIKEQMSSDMVLVIKFEDTGKGIKKEYLESIFDPFFTKKSKGTGLGLAISQRIIQEHGGEIAVKSKPGNGSEFTIYLPVVQ